MSKPPSLGTLTPEDFRRIREVFESALERSPAERVPFVEQACEREHAAHRPKWDGCSRLTRKTTTLLDAKAPAVISFRRRRHFRWPFPNDFSPGPRRHG